MSESTRVLWLLSPVYFDVESYRTLRDRLVTELRSLPGVEARFVIVDDSAGRDDAVAELARVGDVRVVTPPFSLGHQRAIVHGLRRLAPEMGDRDLVATLDADGEDKPEDLPRLLASMLGGRDDLRRVVLAARTQRRETSVFKALYFAFKNVFLLLTGTIIRSGNFAAFHGWLARNVLFHPHFDLCYSSSLISLDLPVERVPCARGSRYAGRSHMTYTKLIMHGIRMLMPFADRIAVRGIALASAALGLGGVVGAALLALSAIDGPEAPAWLAYAVLFSLLVAGAAFGVLGLLFALFVQFQSLAMARLDVRDRPPND